MVKRKADIGVVGLGVMGWNLILNMTDHGFMVSLYNRTREKVDEFIHGPGKGTTIIAARSIEEMVSCLKRPRKVMLMVRSGKPVDDLIKRLIPLLQRGDLVIDGGNSHFQDTIRRAESLNQRGLLYVGAGISGGEEGARRGPSIMPGGSAGAWPLIREIFQSIAARTADGLPCCEWIGGNGAGHYVKMVHNGIEYAEMQAIGEAYTLLQEGLEFDHERMSRIFERWNRTELKSYLLEITADILQSREDDGTPILENILDVAGQKGTGSWSCMSSLELGVPITAIAEAVYARFLSALKDQRAKGSRVLKGPGGKWVEGRRDMGEIRSSLLANRVICYGQGFALMREAEKAYGWKLDLGRIALVWRKGCIIQCALLDRMKEAFDRAPDLPVLFLDPFFSRMLSMHQASWRRVVCRATESGIPVPALSAGLSIYDGYRHARSPANLIQAQRDYFGAHEYERVDQPRGKFFHTNWKEKRRSHAKAQSRRK